jgi:NADPH:quinone reductase-like Zn-dependent oxidoreductase
VKRITVRRSAVIEAPTKNVWAVLRDFNSHAAWHPEIAQSRIEENPPSDVVGCVRRFRLRDGSELREQLLWLSDREYAFRYCILASPVPLIDYVATVRLRPVTDGGGTFCTWEGQFRAPAEQEAQLASLVGDRIYAAGLDALRRHLASPVQVFAPPTPVPSGYAPASGTAEAIVVTRHGGPEVLAWREVPVPAPGPGEVRIRHTAIGVNFIDIYARTGYFSLIEPPGVPGMEATGVVLAVGEGVAHLRPGGRVGYACAPPGAYATERTMPAALVVGLPDDISDDLAASVLLKGLTAEFLLHRVHRVAEGETVLVHAAAGGTGLLLAQWASALGATVIGTVSTEEKARLALAHGCAHAIVVSGEDFVSRVMALTDGRGVDVAYDGVGKDTFLGSYEALATCGHLVSFGQASGPIPPVEIAGFAGKSATVSRPNFGHYTGTRAEVAGGAARLFQALRRGLIRIPPPRRVSLRDAAEAHRALEARETTGATILIP